MIKSRAQAGITLMELMIAVAIVGILGAVALPSYRDYVRRGQLPEAVGALSDYRIKMEQYYQDRRNFGAAGCADGAGAPAWSDFKPKEAKYFGYSCELLENGQGYRVTATGGEAAAKGHVYSIDHDNNRRTTSFKGTAVNKACWLIQGSEC